MSGKDKGMLLAGKSLGSGTEDAGSPIGKKGSSKSEKPNGQNIMKLAQEMKDLANKLKEATAMSLKQQQEEQ